jgi:hypothetical protein
VVAANRAKLDMAEAHIRAASDKIAPTLKEVVAGYEPKGR